MGEAALTERQRYWLDHVKTAKDRGMTLVDYAAEEGLKPKDLYNWKSRLIKLGIVESSAPVRDFVAVRMESEPLRRTGCCVYFSNGVRVEWNLPLSERSLGQILQLVSRLR